MASYPPALALGPPHEVDEAPALVAGQAARLHEADHVAHPALVLLVVHLEAVAPADVLAVLLVPDQALDLHDGGLLHPRRDDRAGHHLALAALLRGRFHQAFASA